MNRRNFVLAFLALLLVAGIAVAARNGVSFDFRSCLQQVRQADPARILAGIALIYLTFFARSIRWVYFLRRHRRLPFLSLLGTQFAGFTAVSLFGRLADLSRPYLVAQKTRLPLALQIAVYTIERMFDLGAAALVFSSALAFAPRSLPHHEIFVRVGIGSLAGTLLLAGFAVSMRVSGVAVAGRIRSALARLSPAFAETAEQRLLAFREGLNAIGSFGEFAVTAGLSLLMWCMIASTYVVTANAFVATPSLAHLSFSHAMLLMAASIGGSLLQLPFLGWFTQIATTAAVMHTFYGTPLESATACGALLLIVTSLSIIPVGLLYARADHVSLGQLGRRAEAEAEVLP